MRLPTTEQLAMMAAQIYSSSRDLSPVDAVEMAMQIWEAAWDFRVDYLRDQKKKEDK